MTDFAPAFLGMFESLRMGSTFSRGRRDERAGHVRSLTVSSSLAVAQVRGPDDPVAFRARIAVRAFGASDWARVESALVKEARYLAGLLDGRMPPGIEAVFAESGLTLLPLSLDEVAMDCTCERWPMPCMHLAATCYALARAFQTDPFEVFAWRGRHRDELLMRLRRLREAAAVDEAAAAATGGAASAEPSSTRGGFAGAASAGSSSTRGGFAGAASAGSSSTQGGFAGAAKTASGAESSAAADEQLIDPDDPDRFWGTFLDLGETPDQAMSGGRSDALLDQLDPPRLRHHGRPINEVLRVAFQNLSDTPGVGRTD
ncbi:putative Zn finger protein [Actinoplanes octamycinicus]|uniref:Putative Zn finger protein n=1 Tax=Actinoplanes octamycinicus TaxID=135948 RepID=A0A7W7GZA6_9ACTN|nr:hypothetical protein [Actinoplanes octamycinicus]MBB4741014.1 putative Zn finger protein [Actinoplanes octamycinicus]GIE55919.1 hypothetical protein Aoc01nite_13210 [Actinoplanes octamycinicus]